jgi:hypothetical protein
VWGKVNYDPSIWNFYPLMAAIGAMFAFERWWTYECGGVNPWHDRKTSS